MVQTIDLQQLEEEQGQLLHRYLFASSLQAMFLPVTLWLHHVYLVCCRRRYQRCCDVPCAQRDARCLRGRGSSPAEIVRARSPPLASAGEHTALALVCSSVCCCGDVHEAYGCDFNMILALAVAAEVPISSRSCRTACVCFERSVGSTCAARCVTCSCCSVCFLRAGLFLPAMVDHMRVHSAPLVSSLCRP
jgi:hypothetical protein